MPPVYQQIISWRFSYSIVCEPYDRIKDEVSHGTNIRRVALQAWENPSFHELYPIGSNVKS